MVKVAAFWLIVFLISYIILTCAWICKRKELCHLFTYVSIFLIMIIFLILIAISIYPHIYYQLLCY